MFNDELCSLREQGLYRKIREIQSAQGPRIRVDGSEVINCASNDYLGLARHPGLMRAAAGAAERFGTGSGASRLLSGTSPLHSKLESEIAQFLGSEAVLLFNSGYAANSGVLSALCGADDLILSDALNHASIVDGCRLSRAEKKIYKHLDYNMLESLLKVNSRHRRRWIITESLFSMDGDLAPLHELVQLADQYGAHIYLDEAHATGVLGEKGRGAASCFDVEDRITLRMGTLGKALGSYGAYVAGERDMIDYLINRSRSLIYSTSLPPAVLAASREAVAIIQGNEGNLLRGRLFANTMRLAQGLEGMGFRDANGQTPILPVVLGTVQKALEAADDLFQGGVFAPAIRPPTVPEGTARIRFTVTASHTQEDMERVLSVMKGLKATGIQRSAIGKKKLMKHSVSDVQRFPGSQCE
jgi:glycine C-acetyltransferase